LPPDQADWLAGALRRHRDRTVVLAVLLAGLRGCEMLGHAVRGRAGRWPGGYFVT
jgi:hypothetical protein